MPKVAAYALTWAAERRAYEWYRYHALFAEAMQHEARRRFGDTALHGLARAASAWYERHGLLAEAIEAALQAQDWERTATLIAQLIETPSYISGLQSFNEPQEFHTLRRWLEQLPDSLLRHHPLLCLYYAIALLFSSFSEYLPAALETLVERVLDDAETGLRATGNIPRLGEVLAYRAFFSEQRGEFGIFGAAAGVGFIVGPALGGVASRISYQAPFYLAAGATVITMLIGYFAMPESLRPENRTTRVQLVDLNLFKQLGHAFALPHLRWLLLTAFCYAFPFAVLQSNWGVLLIDSLGWTPDTIGMLLLLVGVLDIVMQGVLSGRLLARFGETWMTVVGLACAVVAYILMGTIAFVAAPALVYAGIVLYGISSGLIEPALRGLISQAAGPREQGLVQGSSQSVQSLAMVLGPLWAAALYTGFGHASLYWSGAAIFGLVSSQCCWPPPRCVPSGPRRMSSSMARADGSLRRP